MEGYVASPKGSGKKPVVIIVHDWNGLDAYEEGRADMISKLGYIGFAADIYGQGVRPKDRDESAAQAGKYYNDPKLFRDRLTAAYQAAIKLPDADPNRVLVMGYCFGGTGALELSRSGANLVGTASFHGGLKALTPATPGSVHGRVMVFHASDDPAVSRADFNGFLDEMRDAKVDLEVHVFNEATHAFTVPGPMYRERADKRSWALLTQFLKEVFRS